MSIVTGRRVLKTELDESEWEKLDNFEQLPCMKEKGDKIQCLRCGTIHEKKQVKIVSDVSKEFYYCPECIQLGRVDSRKVFYHDKHTVTVPLNNYQLAWNGELTKSQSNVSKKLLDIVGKSTTFLVWAVTGAGKTEMLFESLLTAINLGQRLCIASPRVDVCLELYPRLQAVFPTVDIILLHGKQEESYRETPFVICTTHQLLRFYHVFDFLVIDEVDAFPFSGNEALQYGVKNAIKESGTLVYLTATPPKEMQKRISKGKLNSIIVPSRYHRKKLVEPTLLWCWNWENVQSLNRISITLKKLLNKQIKSGIATLIFCPSVRLVQTMKKLIEKKYKTITVECVYSQDEERLEKVEQMREGKFNFLITTTILERGVTFKGVDVIVYGANHRVFTESALVQISGRVGRTTERTSGDVYFIHSGYSMAMNSAVRQIKQMNRKAQKEGLID